MNKKEKQYLTELIEQLEKLEDDEITLQCLWIHEPAQANIQEGRILLLRDIIKNLKGLFYKPKIDDTDFY